MSEKREYAIIDCLTSVDIRKNAVVPAARTRVGGSHDGKQDLGHVCKSIFEYDNFGFLWVVQEAGVSSPYNDFVYHTGVDELEFVVSGECNFICPDGFDQDLRPGDCFALFDSIPHKNTHDGLDLLNLLVFYPKQISKIDRVEFKNGTPYAGKGRCEVVNCYSTTAAEIAPGMHRLEVFNASTTSMVYQYLTSGASTPDRDFHIHSVDQVIYILGGEGIATYGDKTYRIRPHLAIHNPAGTPYRLMNDGKDDLKMMCYYTTGNVADVQTSVKSVM